jgi:hypothetical protein
MPEQEYAVALGPKLSTAEQVTDDGFVDVENTRNLRGGVCGVLHQRSTLLAHAPRLGKIVGGNSFLDRISLNTLSSCFSVAKSGPAANANFIEKETLSVPEGKRGQGLHGDRTSAAGWEVCQTLGLLTNWSWHDVR